VKTYNAAALELNPPRATLDWSKVSHYTFLEEFNLLADTRQDVRDKPWAQPAIRETMKQALRIKRAHEEIVECNRAIKRLHTSIRDENIHFQQVSVKLKNEGSEVYGAVEDFVTVRMRVNDHILGRILQIYALDGYSGDGVPGIRKGSIPQDINMTGLTPPDQPDDGDEPDEADDATQEDIGSLVDFLSRLTT
jgi:hypothetical protein